MMKNKKIILSIVGIVVGIGIIGSLLYEKINLAENEYVLLRSAIVGIKDNALMEKKELLNIKDKMEKISKGKIDTINIDKSIEEIEKDDYSNTSKLNDHIKQLDNLNKEIDNIIDIYNKDEKMKKDIKITNDMMNIEGLNNLIDNEMNSCNMEYASKFNNTIKRFPVNIVAKSKGWFEVDKFSSIN